MNTVTRVTLGRWLLKACVVPRANCVRRSVTSEAKKRSFVSRRSFLVRIVRSELRSS